jgi:hypothetical protein
MPTVRSGLALLLLSAAATVVRANVALPIYKDDPAYRRARVASQVAPCAVVAAVTFAVAWAAYTRSRAGKVTAVLFGVLALLWCGLVRLGGPGTRFPDEVAGQENAAGAVTSFGRRLRGSPRPITPEEVTILGILAFAILCFGGLVMVRMMARRSQRKGHPPGKTIEAGDP